jgi:hypothetical protein
MKVRIIYLLYFVKYLTYADINLQKMAGYVIFFMEMLTIVRGREWGNPLFRIE